MGGSMVSDDLIREFASWGYQIKPSQINRFNEYLWIMLRRGRVAMVENEEGLQAVIFYFLTDDLAPFENKPTWATPEDSDTGHIFFVDKMLCRKWTKSVREQIREQIEAKYPQVEEGHWLRRPYNRHVILKRGGLLHGI